MMIRKNLLLEVVQLVRQCDCQVLERCSCSKGIGKCCPNPRVSEKEKLRCVHSAFRHDFSHNEVLLENKVFLHAIRIYSIYIHYIYIYIYIYINVNTQTKRFLQSWLRKHFVRLRYKYAKKRVDKGVFIERKGFQSWLKAASRKWQFPLCLRCPPRWRKTIHLGIQLIFENGSMGL